MFYVLSIWNIDEALDHHIYLEHVSYILVYGEAIGYLLSEECGVVVILREELFEIAAIDLMPCEG